VSRTVDLNADLGEGFGAWRMGDDDGLLEVVTSANIACGFHAGDASTMARVCAAAVERGVAIGAHVAYRDLAGFGRRAMDVAPAVVRDEVLYQVGALDGLARAAGGGVAYIKPHGALYHRACSEPAAAEAVAAAAAAVGVGVLGLPGSALLSAAADADVPAWAEGYLDRGYDADGGLVDRRRPGALLHGADEIATRAVSMVRDGRVTAVDGTEVALAVRSLCAHGDEPEALEVARRTRAALEDAGVAVAAFT
jgi:UPF0271 protein